jgi:hypothetical protein
LLEIRVLELVIEAKRLGISLGDVIAAIKAEEELERQEQVPTWGCASCERRRHMMSQTFGFGEYPKRSAPRPYCPLLSAPCLREKCEWWMIVDFGCAMKVLASELYRVGHAVKPPPSETPVRKKGEREVYPTPAAGRHSQEST